MKIYTLLLISLLLMLLFISVGCFCVEWIVMTVSDCISELVFKVICFFVWFIRLSFNIVSILLIFTLISLFLRFFYYNR